MIITDLTEGTSYMAREISQVKPEDRDIVKTSIISSSAICQGKTVVKNDESTSFHTREGRNFLHVKGRDYSFGNYFRDENGWVANSWYFPVGHGCVDEKKSKVEIFETEDDAKKWLVDKYKNNAWF